MNAPGLVTTGIRGLVRQLRYGRRARRFGALREDNLIDLWLIGIREEAPAVRFSRDDQFDLVRTRRGLMIHDASCRYARNGKAWDWARDKSIDELRFTILQFSYRTCLDCRPLAR